MCKKHGQLKLDIIRGILKDHLSSKGSPASSDCSHFRECRDIISWKKNKQNKWKVAGAATERLGKKYGCALELYPK